MESNDTGDGLRLRAPRNTKASKCVTNSLHILPTVKHRPDKLVIAHRGASFHMPEHTMPAYRLALELGADFVEPDIVATQDRKLIAIHSVDLGITTNVAEVFPDREPWYSPYAKKSGFWSFNFTYDQISQLRVKQRLPEMRSLAYDGMFKIPLLEEILEMLIEWNQYELPQTFQTLMENTAKGVPMTPDDAATSDTLRRPSMLELAESGLYLELKDVSWQKEDAEIDLVETMFEHFNNNTFLWNWLMPCYQELEYDTYKVPGLVIQSFELDALSKFHEKWQTSKDETEVPEPPYVVLANLERCETERFWLEIGRDYRKWISAIGPDKRCLIPKKSENNDESQEGGEEEETKTVKWAKEYNLALHPWTERPESSFFSYSNFQTVEDETKHLLCEIGVEGIFSESVSIATSVAKAGCGYDDAFGVKTQKLRQPQEPPYCYDSDREIGVYVGLSFFAIGAFTASLFFLLQRRNQRKTDNSDDSTQPPRSSRYSDHDNTSTNAQEDSTQPQSSKDADHDKSMTEQEEIVFHQEKKKGWLSNLWHSTHGPPEPVPREKPQSQYKDDTDVPAGINEGSETFHGLEDSTDFERSESGMAAIGTPVRAKLQQSENDDDEEYDEEEYDDDQEESDSSDDNHEESNVSDEEESQDSHDEESLHVTNKKRNRR